MGALQGCEWPLTWKASVSLGSLGASVAHTPGCSCVSHESWLPSGPFKTSRTWRPRLSGWGLQPSLTGAASLLERRSPWRGHHYLSLPGDRTHRVGLGAQGPRPILWTRGFPELLGSPHLLWFQEEQQARVAREALDNLLTCITRKKLYGGKVRAPGHAAGGAQGPDAKSPVWGGVFSQSSAE